MLTDNLIEIIEVESKLVSCNGGGGTLGHPQIYLQMGKDSEIVCPYCSRLFRFKKEITATPGD